IAGHERVEVEVANCPCTPSAQLNEVLGELAAKAAVRSLVNRLGERRVSGEMLQGKQLPARIDRVALVLLHSEWGRADGFTPGRCARARDRPAGPGRRVCRAAAHG